MEQVDESYADPADFVHVTRADAPARGSYGRPSRLFLLGVVQGLVVGHNNVGPLGDDQVLRAHLDALLGQAVQLLYQNQGVHHHAVADVANLVLVENARRQKVEDVFIALDHQSVSGVVSSLKTDDVLGLRGEQVYDFPFAFVAPLSSYYDHIGHFSLLSLYRTDLIM